MQAVALSPPDGHAVQLAAQDVRNGRLPTRLPSATVCPQQHELEHAQFDPSVDLNESYGAANGTNVALGSSPSSERTHLGPTSPPSAATNNLKGQSPSLQASSSSGGASGAPVGSAAAPHVQERAVSTSVTESTSSSLNTQPARKTPARSQPPSIVTSDPSLGPSSRRANGGLRPSSVPSTNDHGYSSDLEPTAALIQQLYARLDAQGVAGDGWAEGKERSRDGLINRVGPEDVLREQASRMTLSDDQVKQEQTMTGLDRYGFFPSTHPGATSSQHHRIARLDAITYQTLAGSRQKRPRGPANVKESRRLDVTPEATAVETRRIDKWAEMLQVVRRDQGGNIAEWAVHDDWWNGRDNQGVSSGKYRKLQRRIFKGVPDRWRRAVWTVEMERMARENKDKSRRTPSLTQLEKEYWALVEQPSAQDIQIDLDVPRTISGHVLFHTRYGQGQRALFHVLHAAGLRCLDIGGYCQGMGPIAATLLCYFEPERAYAGLIRLFDQYRLRDIFAPGFPGLVENFHVQERLVEYLMPDVHRAFDKHGISSSSYATKWYITLFANTVPFETQLRFWDALLLEGLDFLVVAAVAIIWGFRYQFTSADASFEDILSMLSSYFEVESNDALMRWIRKTLRMKGIRQRLAQWRAEWRSSQVT
ncbi:hypothetical protein ACM66B_000162 [Microbotryomycetes sp. NB124-2]